MFRWSASISTKTSCAPQRANTPAAEAKCERRENDLVSGPERQRAAISRQRCTNASARPSARPDHVAMKSSARFVNVHSRDVAAVDCLADVRYSLPRKSFGRGELRRGWSAADFGRFGRRPRPLQRSFIFVPQRGAAPLPRVPARPPGQCAGVQRRASHPPRPARSSKARPASRFHSGSDGTGWGPWRKKSRRLTPSSLCRAMSLARQ